MQSRDGGPAFPAEYTNERPQHELIAARNGGASLSFFDVERKPISEMKVGDRVIADKYWSNDRYQTGVIVKLSPPGWVNYRNDEDGQVWATDPSNIRIVPEEMPRLAPLLKDGDVVERLKQFRLRWQESGDLTYLGKALVDAVVEIERLRKLESVREAAVRAEEAIAEFYRYWTGGDMRGSYDGGSERGGLWRAMYALRAALSEPVSGEVEPSTGQAGSGEND